MTKIAYTSKAIWNFCIPIGLIAILFLLITFIGNILIIGSKLSAFHPYLEWTFYGGLICALMWLIFPLIETISVPVISLDDVVTGNNNMNYKTLNKVAQNLINSKVLPEDQHKVLEGAIGLRSDLQEPLANAINGQKESSIRIIREHAVVVLVSTTISQNGLLDTISVLFTNFRLIRDLVNHFGYRPPYYVLIKIYTQIFLAALIADKISDVDFDGILDQFTLGIADIIPGSSLIINSVFNGTMNTLFTLRVGYITRKYLLNASKILPRSKIRKEANSESRQALAVVWKDALPVFPEAIKQIARKFI